MSWPGFAVLCTVSIVAFAAARIGNSRALASSSRAWCSGALLAALVTSVWLRYNPTAEVALFAPRWYAYIRPWWSIVLGLAFLGSAVPQLPERRKRLAVDGFAVFLFVLVSERSVASIRAGADELTGRPDAVWGTCKQTTGFSCGAAASSTLLWQYDIHASESEMARRCLTSAFLGTDEIGVLKGLAEKLVGMPYEVELEQVPAHELREELLPAMASMRLSPLMGHWVVVLARSADAVSIADPLYADNPNTGGIRDLPLAEFAREYGGVLVRLRSRTSSRP